jgi:dinuclear metal center YbgI/SA1388 family protein
MKVADVCAAIEQWAPPELAYSWDKTGLRLGDAGADVEHAVVALSVTNSAAQAAIEQRAQLLVSHHPVFWEPLSNLRTDDPLVRRLLDLAKAGVACYAAHTNFDLAPGGINDLLADSLSLKERCPLIGIPHDEYVKLVSFVPEKNLAEVRHAVCGAGAGAIGDYTYCSFSTAGTGTFVPGEGTEPHTGKKGMMNEESERRFEVRVPKWRLGQVLAALVAAHPYEEPAYDVMPLANKDRDLGIGVAGSLERPMQLDDFIRYVCENFDLPVVRYTGEPHRVVKRVGVLGGGGGGMLKDAPGGIDAVITGDVGYHDAVAALDRGIAVIDAGHDGTEKVFVEAMSRFLEKKFDGLTVYPHIEHIIFREYCA